MIDPLTILAIDPSSTCTGYAVLRGPSLVEAGVLRPRVRLAANDRVRAMAADFATLLADHRPDVVVVEDTSGKVARRHGAGGGAGLAVYGKAVGYLARVADVWAELLPSQRSVELVLENEWTAGERKEARVRRVALEYPGYDPAKDPGGDVGDAIALAAYWQRIMNMRRCVEAAMRK